MRNISQLKFPVIFAVILTAFYFLLVASVNVFALLVLVPLSIGSVLLFRRSRMSFFSFFFFLLPVFGEFQDILRLRAIPFGPALLFPPLIASAFRPWKPLAHPLRWYVASLLVALGVGILRSYLDFQGHHLLGNLVHHWGWNVLSLIVALSGFSFFFLLHQEDISTEKLEYLFSWFLKGMLVCALFSLIQYFGVGAIDASYRSLPAIIGRYDGTFIDSNALGFSTAIALLLCFSVLLLKTHRWIYVLIPALFFLMHISGSRSGLLIFIVAGAALWIMMKSWKKKMYFTGFILLSFSFFFLLSKYEQKKGRELRIASEFKRVIQESGLEPSLTAPKENKESSLILSTEEAESHPTPAETKQDPLLPKIFQSVFQSREEAWSLAWAIISDHWLVGLGAGRYLVDARTYQNEEASGSNDNACNMYLQVAAEQGIIGFLIFLAMTLWLLFQFFQNYRESSLFQRAVFAAYLGALVSFVVGSHIVNSESNMVFWFLIAVMLSKKDNRATGV